MLDNSIRYSEISHGKSVLLVSKETLRRKQLTVVDGVGFFANVVVQVGDADAVEEADGYPHKELGDEEEDDGSRVGPQGTIRVPARLFRAAKTHFNFL